MAGRGSGHREAAVSLGSRRTDFPVDGHAGRSLCAALVHGVANLRGNLCGVVDLAAFMGVSASKPRSEMALSQCWLVALNPLLETNVALLADRLAGLRTMEMFTDSTSPAPGSPAYFGHVYTDSQGAQWQEINLQNLSLDASFLGIGI